MRIIVAFRAFVAALFNRQAAEQLLVVLNRPGLPAPEEKPEKTKEQPKPKRAVRSDALTVLAAFQREARLVDLVQESLDEYSDQQVGAAARDVLRDCRKVLDRMFGLQPVLDQAEGDQVQVPSDFDTNRFRLTGNVVGEPPFTGSLVHHGWEASKVELPEWSGSPAAVRIVAPAEVELGS